jgi:hypothetical protein
VHTKFQGVNDHEVTAELEGFIRDVLTDVI